MVNRTVQQYRLVEKLGAGGMGEIYKARDTRLDRFVAIKVLPPAMSSDPDRRRRFIQEAQAASALNHPNIITIYDIITEADTQFMVVEYIAGSTLLDLIPKDGLRVPQVIQYASQMADALSAAHEAGIVHRDLKPANIMVSSSGLVKLLDFGLAKTLATESSGIGDDASTVVQSLTVEGTLMGTVKYMSPEQAEGKKIDARSDIFSFGSVLYEMLTGKCAFRGDSMVSTLSAILRDEVQPISEVTPDVPPELEGIVARCLKKNPDDRFQSMQEIRTALALLKRQSDSGSLYNRVTAVQAPPPGAKRSFGVVGIVSVIVIGAVIAPGVWWVTRSRSVTISSQTSVKAPAVRPAAASDATMTNDGVIAMVKANVAPSVIVSQVRSSETDFNLSTSEVIRLTAAGVPANVIEAMRNPKAAEVPVKPLPPAPPLEDGLPVALTLAQDVPQSSVTGDTLAFRVAEDVRVNGVVVFRKGAAATGFVVDGGKKKMLAFGGKMTFRLDKVTGADGQKVSLRATAERPKSGVAVQPVTSAGATKTKDMAAVAGAAYTAYVDNH